MPIADRKAVYERVFTVLDYYDGPRQGVANFHGEPHFYECCFDEGEDLYTDQFRLTPLSLPHLDLILEDWEIWRRWELAFHSGEATKDSFPALPTDKARHEQLKPLLDPVLRTDNVRSIIKTGFFKVIDGQNLPQGVMRDLEVMWSTKNS